MHDFFDEFVSNVFDQRVERVAQLIFEPFPGVSQPRSPKTYRSRSDVLEPKDNNMVTITGFDDIDDDLFCNVVDDIISSLSVNHTPSGAGGMRREWAGQSLNALFMLPSAFIIIFGAKGERIVTSNL